MANDFFAKWLVNVPEMTDEEYEIVERAENDETEANCEAAQVVVDSRAKLVYEAYLAWSEEHREVLPVDEDEYY